MAQSNNTLVTLMSDEELLSFHKNWYNVLYTRDNNRLAQMNIDDRLKKIMVESWQFGITRPKKFVSAVVDMAQVVYYIYEGYDDEK